MALEQFCGLLPDTNTPGGSTFDQIAATWATTAPAPTIYFPPTEVAVERTQVLIDRDDEIRGEIDSVPPLTFREAWTVTITGKLYPYVAKRLDLLATGATDVKTGTSPAAITHKFVPIGYTGSFGLPACHIVVVRDDLAEAFSGCQLDTLVRNFPIDGEATYTATFLALYRKPLTGYTPPAESYASLEDWVYMLRDTDVFLDASSTAMDSLRGFELTNNNQFRDPEWWPKRNREIVIDSGVKHIIWHPARRKRGTRRITTGRLMFSDIKTAQERRRDLVHAQKLVVEVEGQDLATTPAAKEMFRFTGQKTVYTGGGPENMTRDSDQTTSYDFGVYRDSAIAAAYQVEYVDASNALLTFAP